MFNFTFWPLPAVNAETGLIWYTTVGPRTVPDARQALSARFVSWADCQLRAGQIMKEEGKDYTYRSLQGSRMEIRQNYKGAPHHNQGLACSILTGHGQPESHVKSPGLVFWKLNSITTLRTPAFPISQHL